MTAAIQQTALRLAPSYDAMSAIQLWNAYLDACHTYQRASAKPTRAHRGPTNDIQRAKRRLDLIREVARVRGFTLPRVEPSGRSPTRRPR